MLTFDDCHDYQVSATDFIDVNENCALFLDMGLGKTVISLTAAARFIADFRALRVLVVAPLRVAETVWEQECRQWEHLNHLKVNIITGNLTNRLEQTYGDADIYTINRENFEWLQNEMRGRWKWEMLIVDESQGFKDHKSERFKAYRRIKKHKTDNILYTVLLSGTPSPQSVQDLWAQIFMIDGGKRLGRNITEFRKRYMVKSFDGYSWEPRPGALEDIQAKIADIAISMQAEDYLDDLPDRIDITRSIALPTKYRKQYKELEREFLLTIDNEANTEIAAVNAAAKAQKCLQFCNGAVYDEDRETHLIHDLKIEALKEVREDNPNERMLVAYSYKSDLPRILEAFPEAIFLEKGKKGNRIQDRWNAGQVPMLVCHPASAGHGLNLQHGGSLAVWFGLNWSVELYLQFNARLHRQGQKDTVRIVHLVAEGCLDEDVLVALGSKIKNQQQLIDYLKFPF
jgi:SNF2 family DNA or RNA helicase